MAEFVTYRMEESEEEILPVLKEKIGEDKFNDYYKIFIMPITEVEGTIKDWGDYLTNTNNENYKAIIARETINSKIIPDALKCGLSNLLFDVINNGLLIGGFIISKTEFVNIKEEAIFISQLKYLVKFLYGSETFNEDNKFNLILSDYNKIDSEEFI